MENPILIKCKVCQWKGDIEELLPDLWGCQDYCPQCTASFAAMYKKELDDLEKEENEKTS